MMWVFESRDISRNGGYSPLTTPFGYYGLMFHDGCVKAGSGFNFSMWAAGRGATEAPPLERMPRLIATGLPDAQFSAFGGEGTGVKLRGSAYTEAAQSTIQALRVAVYDGVPTYFGYFYDEPTHRWRLYCAGQKPAKRGNPVQAPGRLDGNLSRTGSFLEVPGAPGRVMNGDLVRTTARRGWFYGSDGKFYPAVQGREEEPVDQAETKPAQARPGQQGKAPQTTANAGEGKTTVVAANQMVYKMADYGTQGWVAMTMGGMEYYSKAEQPVTKGAKPELPEYLRPDKVAGLFRVPVDFGASKISSMNFPQAVLDYELKETGPNSKAALYYGTVDCITFQGNDSGELKKGTPTMQAMVSKERTWQSRTPGQSVKAGINQFRLSGLKSGTAYYYRLYVEHDEGKSWDYVSGIFKTP
jgi:hypothetical protein